MTYCPICSSVTDQRVNSRSCILFYAKNFPLITPHPSNANTRLVEVINLINSLSLITHSKQLQTTMSNTNNVDLQAPADPDEWLASDETMRPTTYSLDIRILATAVLSLALVLAFLLFLHLYIRYVLRRNHRSHHHRQSTTAIIATTLRIGFAAAAANNNNNNNETPKRPGLDPSSIAALPSFPYAEREAADCAVCLSAVEAGETVRRLPGCGHVFHVRCVDAWLETNSSCPVCRAGVEPPPPVPVSADVAVAGDAAVGGKEEAVGSVSARLSTSLRRMLSRERSGRGAAVAPAGEIAVEDLERQQ